MFRNCVWQLGTPVLKAWGIILTQYDLRTLRPPSLGGFFGVTVKDLESPDDWAKLPIVKKSAWSTAPLVKTYIKIML